MKLSHELSYDAPPDDVLAMLQNPAYWDRVAAAVGARDSSANVMREGERVQVVIDQMQEVVGVPGFAKKFVGDSTRAIKTQVWTGTTSTVDIDTPGKPTRIIGTAEVRADGAGSVLAYDLDVKASVPLVSGKLERLVAELTAEGLDKEGDVGAKWLRGER